MSSKDNISVFTTINSDMDTVWNAWTQPEHITEWNFATPEWCCPKAENHLEEGKTFNYRMEAKDGSMGFDYAGTYTKIKPKSFIAYLLEDGRKVTINFEENNDVVSITQNFEVEDTNTVELQQKGWQAILENFRNYVEK